MLATALLLAMTASAQENSSRNESDELEQKIKDDILRQLRREITKVLLQQNLLNRQIERGIDSYFKKQQEALSWKDRFWRPTGQPFLFLA